MSQKKTLRFVAGREIEGVIAMRELAERVRREFYKDFTRAGLKAAIIVWAIFVIVLAFLIDNKWILAGILAYEVLP